jgi:hypothetical protein
MGWHPIVIVNDWEHLTIRAGGQPLLVGDLVTMDNGTCPEHGTCSKQWRLVSKTRTASYLESGEVELVVQDLPAIETHGARIGLWDFDHPPMIWVD